MKTSGLSREAAGRRIVDDISIEASRGEILAIMGPSGSGKSSFLRLLNRLDEPSAGTVFLDNVETRTLPPRELRRRVGMVLQTPYLFPGTIADNLAFGPRQRGGDLQAEQIEALLNQVGLAGYADRDIGRLSGGEAQRVSVARTLANDPEVLLLDEPTSALDANSKAEVERLIAMVVCDRNLACVMVTHDPEQARRIAHCVMVLIAGKLDRIGPAAEILKNPVEIPLDRSSPASISPRNGKTNHG